MRFVLLAAAAVALSTSAFAAPKWTADYAKSHLQFDGAFGQNKVTGTFAKYTADVAFDKADLATSKITVTVDMKTATTKVAPDAIYEKPTDGALPGAGWFNTAAFATAKFESTAITSKGGDNYEAKGKLTIRGVTKEIALPFSVKVTGNTAVAEGKVTVSRIDFGIKGDSPQYSLPKPVPFDVAISFSISATR